MKTSRRSFVRMSGMDQILWNLTHDKDFFCIWGIATLGEPLKEDLVKQALAYLIQSVPVLHSRVITNPFYGRWMLTDMEDVEHLIVTVNAGSDDEAREHVDRVFLYPIDATQDARIRLHVISGPSTHYLVIQVHHLAVDGEGLKRLCVAFADIYRSLYTCGQWDPGEAFHPDRSWSQIAGHFSFRHLWLIPKACVVNARDMLWAILRNRLTYKIKGDRDQENGLLGRSTTYFESVILDREAMTKLKTFANDNGYTVNDIFMASLAMAVKTWNRDHGDRRNWLKFGYTANLRRWWGEPRGTFANYSAILMHGEHTRNLCDPQTALASTKRKMDKVKTFVGLDGFAILPLMACLPYVVIKKIFGGLREKLFDTVLTWHAMTNIGIVFAEAGDFGHTRATDYTLLAPTFPGGTVIYTISTYDKRTTLHLGSSSGFLTRNGALDFLDLWKKMIMGMIGSSY